MNRSPQAFAHRLATAMIPFLAFTACQTTDHANYEDPRLTRDLDELTGKIPEASFSWWDENPPPRERGKRRPPEPNGPLRITLDLSEQAAYFHRGHALVGRSRIATGRSGFRTPTGDFTMLKKDREKRSNIYGTIFDAEGKAIKYGADVRTDEIPEGGRFVGAPLSYWMRLTNDGIGMHAGTIRHPGRPASHGCIRMPKTMARTLFEKSEIGTPVSIVP